MKISITATNPCHVYHMALELQALEALDFYYSGYPKWRLPGSDGLNCKTHSWRTVLTYAALKLPEKFRPAPRDLFLWQDTAFDRWVGTVLEECDFIHGLPGQCRKTFQRAEELNICRVLNHATGPVRQWVETMQPEYERVGMDVEVVSPYDEAYFTAAAEEYELTDVHCVASSLVKSQLVEEGIPEDRIWVVPYGVDGRIFHNMGKSNEPGGRILFAGQFGLRKGTKTLLDSLKLADGKGWVLDVYGGLLSESKQDLDDYEGTTEIKFHGSVSQASLAEAMRSSGVLVLPSLEEGFGLVVVQALACGLPCIVSDRTGAKDLIRHRENGSIVPVGDAESLFQEIQWWLENPKDIDETHGWKIPAAKLVDLSRDWILR